MSEAISSAVNTASGTVIQPVKANVPPQGRTPAAAHGQEHDLPEKVRIDVDPGQKEKDLDQAIERLNEQMKEQGRALNFSVDKVLDRTVVIVKNSQTGHVVRQIPDASLLSVAHNLERVKGLLQDGKI